MNIDKAVDFVQQRIYENTDKPLNDSEIKLLQGSLKGWNYSKIAENESYSAEYLEKQLGPNLWRKITKVLGIPVKKTNIGAVLTTKLREQDSRFAANLSSQQISQKEVVAESTPEDVETLVQEVRSHPLPATQPQASAIETTTFENSNFLGRREAIADLRTFVTQGEKVILIYGKGGVGKTKLAEQYFETQGLKILRLDVGTETQSITRVEDWIEDRLQIDFQEQLGQNFYIMRLLDRLRRQLQTQRFGVFIDNIETALDENGKFLKAHRSYVELIRLLTEPSVQCITLITSRERLKESKVMVKQYLLEGLNKEAWRQFFSNRDIKINFPALSDMHQAYGGNALAMKILCAATQKYYEGNLAAYWQHNQGNLLQGELRDLVASQFDRLQKSDSKAYQLLFRLGIYRYQSIPRVPIVGIRCLLWDISEEQQWQVIESLLDRSLVEFQDGGYWLHPVIQAEAISRLKSNEKLDDLLLFMKKEIDKLLAFDEELQQFLTWVNQKSSEVISPYKPAAIRAIYFDLGFRFSNFGFGLSSELPFTLDDDFALDCASYNIGLAINFHNTRSPDIALDQALTSLLDDLFFPVQPFLRVPFVSMLENALGYATDIQVQLELQQLREQVPDPIREEEIFEHWLEAEGQNWIKRLKNLVINHRQIRCDWSFSNQQKEVLKQYYCANNLLGSCLSSASSKVRDEIKDQLLLPTNRD